MLEKDKKVIAGFVVCCLLSTCLYAAPTVTVTRTAGYFWSGGGEFTLTPSANLSWVLQYYDSKTKGIGGGNDFQSFCIEVLESIVDIPPNNTYDVVLNDRAIMGQNPPNGDPLSVGAAWLYHEFQKGTLQNYDYVNIAGGGRAASAGVLQQTLWWLEGESLKPADTTFVTMLVTKFGSEANAMADNAGQYPVLVLNLYDLGHAGDTNYLKQDMLVCVPAPGAVLLGSIGVCLVGWLRRRRML